MTNEQISKVLMDDNKEMTITSAQPLMLNEGYQLNIKSVDVKGNKAYIELSKNGQVVDDKVVQGLLKKFADFGRAYNEGGMSPAEFDTFGPTVRTLRQFIVACYDLAGLVRTFMLPDPPLKTKATTA